MYSYHQNVHRLNEVVVVGYGTQKRANIIGAVDQISSKAIEGKPSVNLTQALQGTSPNLLSSKPTPSLVLIKTLTFAA
jgi:hypothetical protein